MGREHLFPSSFEARKRSRLRMTGHAQKKAGLERARLKVLAT
jgi:hypothetical protein